MNVSISVVQIGSIKITPIHLIGLIDPDAIWLDRIMVRYRWIDLQNTTKITISQHQDHFYDYLDNN